jgi:xanthine dehydrogenase accessory factor
LDLYKIIQGIEESGIPSVMATLVATRGTSPKPVGTKMFVSSTGELIGSVTIGGCVDARVVGEAAEVGPGNPSKLISVDLSDDEAVELGLTCGGTVDVLLEHLAPDHQAFHTYRAVQEELDAGGTSVRCVEFDDSLTIEMAVVRGAKASGRLTSSELEKLALLQADENLLDGRSQLLEIGGRSVFFELHVPSPLLLVVGANDVAVELVKLAAQQGYRTVVVDSRPRFATAQRFPDAHEVLVGIPSELVQQVPLTSATSVAIVVHDHKFEVPVLEKILSSEANYLGLLGGRKRTDGVKKLLSSRGFDSASLGRICTPIGLDIGARTAPELALCILAEILAERRGRKFAAGRKLS